MQCYKVSELQHLIMAEYYASSLSPDLIPMLSYIIGVTIICNMSNVEYMLYMQCC